MQVLTFSCLKKHSIFSSRNTLLQETRFWKTLGIFFRATRFPSLGSVTDLREEYKSYLVRIIFVNSNHRFTFHFNDRLYKQPSGLMIESKAAWSKRTNILTSEVKHHGSMGSIIYRVPLKPFHEGMAWGFFFLTSCGWKKSHAALVLKNGQVWTPFDWWVKQDLNPGISRLKPCEEHSRSQSEHLHWALFKASFSKPSQIGSVLENRWHRNGNPCLYQDCHSNISQKCQDQSKEACKLIVQPY